MAQATYREIETWLLPNLEPFEGNSLSAYRDRLGGYHVVSYSTEIAIIAPSGRVTYYDERYYSQTTARHQGCIRRAFGLSRESIGVEENAHA